MGTKAHGGTFQLSGNAQNRPTGMNYDAAGNLLSYLTANYTYDQENRLSSTAGMSYTYDGNGERVLKSNTSTGAPVKRYWSMGGNTLAEGDGTGNLTAEYIYLDDLRVARVDLPANTVHYYLSDHLGSTSIIASSTGAIEEESDYSPFGTEFMITGPGINELKFTGKRRDTESQLDYFGSRHYGNILGRFISPDQPFADEDEGNPQSWNMYAYAGNNPLRNVDPNGQSHVDKNGFIVGDYNGECINGGSLCWDAKNQQWDKPHAPAPRMDNGAVNPGFLGPFDIFFFGRLPGGTAASTAEKAAARIAAEAAAKAATEAAAKAAAEAALKKEVAELLGKAASTVGNQGVQATSRQAAEQAAKEWVGQGAKPIMAGRGTGQIIGEVSADGSKVARFTSAGKASPYINLENKATGGNLHVHF
jgi:RHS repeat-associated protein